MKLQLDLKQNWLIIFERFVKSYFMFAFTQVFGGRQERVSLLKGSAKVVLYAIARLVCVLQMCACWHI